jgi:hypothetical protein
MSDIVERLRSGEDGLEYAAADEIERLRDACTKMNTEVCQRLGKALGYPWFKDDQENFPGATEENGVCTGEHVAESIAAEAADWIGKLEAQRDEAVERGNDWCDQAKKARAERDRLRVRHSDYMNDFVQMGMARDDAEAERDRLRETLREIVGTTMSQCVNAADLASRQHAIARAALKETGHE